MFTLSLRLSLWQLQISCTLLWTSRCSRARIGPLPGMLSNQRLALYPCSAVALCDPLLSIPITPLLLVVLDLVSRASIIGRDGTLAT